MRRVVFFLAVGLPGLGGCLFVQRFYVVREALVFLASTALLAFFGFSLLLLVLLLQEAGRSILRLVSNVGGKIPSPKEVQPERQVGRFEVSPTIGEIQRIGSS